MHIEIFKLKNNCLYIRSSFVLDDYYKHFVLHKNAQSDNEYSRREKHFFFIPIYA